MASPPSTRPLLTPVLLTVAAVGCTAVGAWQWFRLEGAIALDHNVGYALLWPLFGLFLIVAAWAHRRPQRAFATAVSTSARLKATAARELPPGLLPDRAGIPIENDPATTAYNTYLARLNDSELHHRLREAGLDRT
ncbi:transcriptional regulator [Nocardia cyriacigeorgica]|uniref:transcriptional regulator n=1 Tax=Nocardia cyriacigeorgica TaxID=135487 RepID=UPI0018943451|nr:transcriptional regulator [Nocardia cyriacigeorgica]MBF6440263.1 transcriptional regulator [Nocardia cyriacigeorgica]MBF6457069.1 transcriptional regulator [Nocardia cyriacigeorgica]MBF6476738.1 transcriptional regulator [Nocardia cyriacigeorgica]MBF6554270.1 transcriptional regulator [Nocardia cyriacigeorgica]